MSTAAALEELITRLEAVEGEVSRLREPNYHIAVNAFPQLIGSDEEMKEAIGRFGIRIFHGDISWMDTDLQGIQSRLSYGQVSAELETKWKTVTQARLIYTRDLEGGRRAFLNYLFTAFLSWEVRRRTELLVSEFWNKVPTDLEVLAALADVYFARCGHLFPSDVAASNRWGRGMMLHAFLVKHASLISTLRATAARTG